ncbi:MAG: prkC 8 [Phycisphaerales bacterium]|nr:prkC 8 [Phycisphaerales bacterium]
MRGFQYKHGDRPLEGYTIQRAAGRGGFGEVYYALSDAGREVALKVVQTYGQIEIRGISHCMNLKSPHLVTVFDVKYGQDGMPFVIMEFVSGPSLRGLIDAAPAGLGTQKAAFFLREIAKGLTYLHDCGIVHRDLKPANIFFENGYVKIGDYGLSKAISADHHTGQTVTVGTVHYMAPEIGEGRYDKGIDIYALGVLLYEMLTGQVPFFGASPGEVLMKHLSASADLTSVEEPFATVIRKAMAKNPADRYQSVQEMVEAVFGAEHVRNSVSHFSPDSLTIVAGQAARKIGAGSGALTGSFTPSDGPAQEAATGWRRRWGRWPERCGERFAYLADVFPTPARREAWAAAPRSAPDDPLPRPQRKMLTLVAIATVALGTGLAAGAVGGNPAAQGMFALLAMVGATFGVIFGSTRLLPAVSNDLAVLQRLAAGGVALLCATLASAPVWASVHVSGFPDAGATLAAICVCLVLLDWRSRCTSAREQRINPNHLISAAVVALIVALIMGAAIPVVIGVIVGTSLAVDVAWPWSPSVAARNRRVGKSAAAGPVIRPAQPPFVVAKDGGLADSPLPQSSSVAAPGRVVPLVVGTPVHRHARFVWLIGFMFSATLGLFLWTMLMVARSNPDERAMQLGIGTIALIVAVFCLHRQNMTAFPGWRAYLWRPLVMLACISSFVISLSFLSVGELRGDDAGVAVFFLICSAVFLFAIKFLVPRGQAPRGGDMSSFSPGVASSSFTPARTGFSPAKIAAGFGRLVLTLIGSVLLLAAVLVAIAVVVDVPGFFDSHLVDPDIHREMRQTFGTADWPRLMREAATVVNFLLGLIATVLFLAARRHRGAGHMLRAVLAVGGLFFAVLILGRSLPEWSDLVARPNGWEIVDQYLEHVARRGAFEAGALAVAAIFLLMWPANRERPMIVQNIAAGQEAKP